MKIKKDIHVPPTGSELQDLLSAIKTWLEIGHNRTEHLLNNTK